MLLFCSSLSYAFPCAVSIVMPPFKQCLLTASLFICLIIVGQLCFSYREETFVPINNNFEDEFRPALPPQTLSRPAQTSSKPASHTFNDIAGHDTSFAVYNPYPDYNSRSWRRRWRGTHVPCKGPRGVDVNGNYNDMLVAHSIERSDSLSKPYQVLLRRFEI